MKKYLVLGLGISGKGAAEFLLKRNQRVVGIDRRIRFEDPEIGSLIALGLCAEREEASICWEEIAQVIVSPGIAPTHPLIFAAQEHNVPVVGEAAFALSFCSKPMVAITGTNGKTTVALLTAHILNSAGICAKALGNVGVSLCAFLSRGEEADAYVVELSSYQLETMQEPVFEAGVLLNITPDHLDRYQEMGAYAQVKFRLRACVKKSGRFSVFERAAQEFGPGGDETFGWGPGAQLWTDGKCIRDAKEIEFLLPIGYRWMGRHDVENVLAAWALCRPFAIAPEQFCGALETFCKPAHRLEFVRTVNEVSYYNDSKGTNIDATIQAVRAMQGPVILIAGGVDKGASYLPWKELLSDKIRQVIAIGQAAPKIYNELNPYFPIKLAGSLNSAVEIAGQDAVKGDCVLLSPGCSSYDMFRDYAHRGEAFKQYVMTLGGI